MEFRLKDFHQLYKKVGNDLDLKTFKSIVQTFLDLSLQSILEGNELLLGYHIGRLKVARYERNYNKPTVNWGESNKYKARLLAEGKPLYDATTNEGYQWLVYFTDSYYYGFTWKKEKIKSINYAIVLHNAQFYELKPFARTKRKLTASINELSPVIFDLE